MKWLFERQLHSNLIVIVLSVFVPFGLSEAGSSLFQTDISIDHKCEKYIQRQIGGHRLALTNGQRKYTRAGEEMTRDTKYEHISLARVKNYFFCCFRIFFTR